jgi:hypothetical protein
MGLNIQGYPNLDRTKKELNCQKGLNACKQLRIETYVTPKELSDPEVESIGVMATVVQLKYLKPVKSVNEKAKIIYTDEEINNAVVGKPVSECFIFLSANSQHYLFKIKII